MCRENLQQDVQQSAACMVNDSQESLGNIQGLEMEQHSLATVWLGMPGRATGSIHTNLGLVMLQLATGDMGSNPPVGCTPSPVLEECMVHQKDSRISLNLHPQV